jgi:hypothetical protein
MAWIYPVIQIAAVAAGTAAAVQQGRVARQEAMNQQAMADYEAKVAEQDARAAEAKTRFDQIRQQKEGQRFLGRLAARLGASGAVMDEGAPLTLMAEQAGELALENMLIGVEGRTVTGRYQSQGTLASMQGRLYGQRGENAYRTGLLRGGSTLLQGFNSMNQQGSFG